MGRRKRKKSWVDKQQQQQKPAVVTTIPVTTEVKIMSTKTIKQTREFQGMMTCILEHTVTDTKANYEWSGPKISPAVWNEVLAFFKWTYDTTKSESQVRLYCNYRTREWKAWAFPQIRGTGMTTKELDDHPQTAIQRARFSDQDGWFYYGTVHHHCSTSAFQSGTDERNENNQEGLHITVGHLDRALFDIDARLYHAKTKITNMQIGWFWDVGNPLEGVSPMIAAMMPAHYKENFCKLQMGTPPAADLVFPEIWKENLIAPPVSTHVHTTSYHGTYKVRSSLTPWSTRSLRISDFDIAKAESDLEELFTNYDENSPLTMEDCLEIVRSFSSLKQADFNVLDVMLRNDMTIAAMEAMIKINIETREELLAEAALAQAMGYAPTTPMGQLNAAKVGRKNKAMKMLGNTSNAPRREIEDHSGNGIEQSKFEYEGGAYPGYGAGFGIGG